MLIHERKRDSEMLKNGRLSMEPLDCYSHECALQDRIQVHIPHTLTPKVFDESGDHETTTSIEDSFY